MTQLILASGSKHRAQIMQNAGLSFRQISSDLDERSIEAPLEAADVIPEDRAEILAEAKAINVSEKFPGEWVIGCDQILALDGEVLHKVSNMEEARRRLLALSGKPHQLHSAVTLVKDEETCWRHVSTCKMSMRDLEPDYIGRHLSLAGSAVFSSVGAYQVEGLGAHLFNSIEGDVFSIIGLPLFPLLDALRNEKLIDG